LVLLRPARGIARPGGKIGPRGRPRFGRRGGLPTKSG
jgi:hypothetical protein